MSKIADRRKSSELVSENARLRELATSLEAEVRALEDRITGHPSLRFVRPSVERVSRPQPQTPRRQQDRRNDQAARPR